MTAEIVSALNNLTTVNKELAGKRQAEADKESQDRKDERVKLQKIIDNGKKSESDRNEAKEELRKLNKKEDLAKEVSTEISRSAAALLGISDEQFKSSKEQQLIQKDQGKSTEKVIEAIKLSTVDPLAERKNAAAIMEAQLIANGRVATQNAAYNREMSAIKQEEIKARRDQAETPAERAEIQAELESERKKNQGLLGKIAGGLGGLLKQGKEKVVGAVKGVFGFIKGLADEPAEQAAHQPAIAGHAEGLRHYSQHHHAGRLPHGIGRVLDLLVHRCIELDRAQQPLAKRALRHVPIRKVRSQTHGVSFPPCCECLPKL